MKSSTRKFLKFVNQGMYVLSIAMLISGMLLSLAAKPVAAATGAIWTTTGSCGSPQNINHYNVYDVVYVNYSNLAVSTLMNWSITQKDGNPKPIVASGTYTTTDTGTGCFSAYTIQPSNSGHEYSVDMAGKNDNYQVNPYTPPNPVITIDKSAAAGTFDSVGDIINYSILVSNAGNQGLTNVSVTDPGVTSLSCPATSLAVGANMTCTGIHVVNQTDLDAGSYTNTASATSDQVGPVTDSVTVPMTQSPAMTVDKAGPANGLYAVGAALNYTITVTNTGNVTLDGVTVTDSSATVGSCTPANGSSLAPGASMSCAASHTLNQTDIDSGQYLNTATGTSGKLSGSDSVTVTLQRNPSMSIVKSEESSGPYIAGQTITFSIVATNTGNITLTNATVSDPDAVLGSCSPSNPATLAPGGTITCSATHVVLQSDMDSGSYANTAYGDSNETSQVKDTETITFGRAYALSFEKKIVGQGPYGLGSTINYSLELENIGNSTLTNVSISDNAATLGNCTPAIPVASLAPHGTVVCAASHVVDQTDIDLGHFSNTATGSSNETDPVSDSQNVTFAQTAGLSIDKAVTAGVYGFGDSIPYTITASNTGQITLHNVNISDPSAVIDSCSPVLGSSLAPGASMVCSAIHVVNQTDMDAGSYENTATATSTEAGPVQDTQNVMFVQHPNLSIVKTVSSEAQATYAVGDMLTYSIVLTNTGDITLHNVTIADLAADLGSCAPSVPAASLAVGASITCSASHAITQADLDAGVYENTAVGDSNETDPKQDSVTVQLVQGPAISFEKKEVSQGPYVVDSIITYSFELTNIGNVTLHNVTISDPKATFGTCTPALPVAELAPLAKVTCSATHVVTAAEIAAGLTFVNTAVGDSNETDPASDSVSVTLAIKGCTDPNASNYNSSATVNDGSCQYPENPTPTPVPTLPIPATGGTVLIPVTGADLSNTMPAGSLPRGLFLSGMSVFGFAMVLSGLRRKKHL